jgi:hypothetical protein
MGESSSGSAGKIAVAYLLTAARGRPLPLGPMPRLPAFVLFLTLIMTPPLPGQAAPRPEDVATLDGLIKAFYDVVSGPAGGRPDRARDHTLHWPGARIGLPQQAPEGPRLMTMSLDDYHDRFGQARTTPFYEWTAARCSGTA